MLYKNLREEMIRNNVTIADISRVINKSEHSVKGRMKGMGDFSWNEVLCIRNTFFPGMSVEYLFAVGADTTVELKSYNARITVDSHGRARNSLTRQQLEEIAERIEYRSFKGNRIRVVKSDDQKWIVFADICKVLGYKNPNHESKRLLPDEKCRIDIGLKNTLAVCVNEDGLLALRLFSSKDGAEEFFEWASSEIFS